MSSKPFIRLAGVFGIISPVLTFTLIGLAIAQAGSWFVWTERALSDLGVHAESAMLFNSALIIGGILDVIFAYGVIQYYRTQDLSVGRSGAFFLLLSGIFLTSIGVFPENSPNNIHYIVSVAFFSTLALSLLIQSAALLLTPTHRKLGTFTLIIALIATITWIIWMPLKPYPGVAIPETISATAGAAWSVVMGTKLLKTKQP